jgi:hypothetical protein
MDLFFSLGFHTPSSSQAKALSDGDKNYDRNFRVDYQDCIDL